MISEGILRAGREELERVEGITTNIERYAINDGFGLRTTVFLKGCPLRCRWCSNPETQECYPEMSFFGDKCIHCGACMELCKHNAIPDDMIANREICRDCYKSEHPFGCTEQCYPRCRKVTGDKQTAKEVVDIVKRDMAFYELSGGGVTISGGEPLGQPAFTYALLKCFAESWIDTAIETCAHCAPEDIEAIAPYVKFVFVDLKHMDAAKHRLWTGQPNGQILENIKLLDRQAGKIGFDLLIRIPLIPGFNDTEGEIDAIARFMKENLKNVKGAELLPYHKLGRGKYISLGREYGLADMKAPEEGAMETFNRVLFGQGIEIYQF